MFPILRLVVLGSLLWIAAPVGSSRADAPVAFLNPTNFVSLGASFNPLGTVYVDTATLLMTGAASFQGVSSGGTAVFTFDSVSLAASYNLIISGPNPFSLLSKADMTIAGSIDFSAASPGANGGNIELGANGTLWVTTSGQIVSTGAKGAAGSEGSAGGTGGVGASGDSGQAGADGDPGGDGSGGQQALGSTPGLGGGGGSGAGPSGGGRGGDGGLSTSYPGTTSPGNDGVGGDGGAGGDGVQGEGNDAGGGGGGGGGAGQAGSDGTDGMNGSDGLAGLVGASGGSGDTGGNGGAVLIHGLVVQMDGTVTTTGGDGVTEGKVEPVAAGARAGPAGPAGRADSVATAGRAATAPTPLATVTAAMAAMADSAAMEGQADAVAMADSADSAAMAGQAATEDSAEPRATSPFFISSRSRQTHRPTPVREGAADNQATGERKEPVELPDSPAMVVLPDPLVSEGPEARADWKLATLQAWPEAPEPMVRTAPPEAPETSAPSETSAVMGCPVLTVASAQAARTGTCCNNSKIWTSCPNPHPWLCSVSQPPRCLPSGAGKNESASGSPCRRQRSPGEHLMPHGG